MFFRNLVYGELYLIWFAQGPQIKNKLELNDKTNAFLNKYKMNEVNCIFAKYNLNRYVSFNKMINFRSSAIHNGPFGHPEHLHAHDNGHRSGV